MKTGLLNIGMIGLDTSHAPLFAEMLNHSGHPHHVPGGRVTTAFPGGSPDFPLSISRVPGYTAQIRDDCGVRMVETVEAVAEETDALMLLTVDGRLHVEQFAAVAPYGKPVFIDKPFALSSGDAQAISHLASKYNVPLMSCSSVRYAENLAAAAGEMGKGELFGVDCYGPMELQPTQPGFFWYGIHMAEMLYRCMGTGCTEVRVTTGEEHDLAIGVWADGRIGTLRGNRKGNKRFGALLHREKETDHVDIYAQEKPYYASMLEAVIRMFQTETPPIPITETLEVIAFLEAANESRTTGKAVPLNIHETGAII
ncbi:Gfo/Idh/MocA family oxidoreductase [Paenibacillus dokdonensis]|uniref:Gfo/Idh/MocA family oxidoreductase n=1 Tax=Paenibacillus dokdonensis TaxID=2567944 RepID=A0ABU6GQR4_9BACL|nr:Gfo/Idh/MocA family oxidoreductase [Paenibacillus dokdonensis]MEC0241060.1 Gfo/Idh/MocA family oxidoreductase [Paenibacillus dokdonensis]